jgi:CRISPR/Cas system CSM-associated protein Csm3 (group 7 of RAMP superfamily)
MVMGRYNMSSHRFFEIEVTLLSPTILTHKITKTGYLKPLDHIPGSTLRGAILTALYYYGYLNQVDLKNEATEPSLLATPAYPIISVENRDFQTLPATPFDFECKLCSKKISKLRVLTSVLEKGLYQQVELTADCPEHGSMKTLYSKLLARGGKKPSLNIVYTTSVAINKATRTAMRGMLYNYEAIAPGLRFWARVAFPDHIVSKLEKKFEISIGRGRSRGFGRAQIILLTEHEPEFTSLPTTFIALSPLLPLKMFTWGSCSVVIDVIYGRTFKIIGGWDMAYGLRRPIVTAVKRGAVLKTKIKYSEHCDVRTFLTMLSHGGVPVKYGNMWLTGFNVLFPLEEYLNMRGDIGA